MQRSLHQQLDLIRYAAALGAMLRVPCLPCAADPALPQPQASSSVFPVRALAHQIKRSVGGHEVVTVLDGKKMARDRAPTPFVVLPGDIISVSERIF